MNNYCMIQNSKTFAFSAENPTGVRAGGSQGGDCTKLRPTVTIPAGETVTLVDAAGPGVIQHMEVVDNASDENNENTRRKATVVPIKIEYV